MKKKEPKNQEDEKVSPDTLGISLLYTWCVTRIARVSLCNSLQNASDFILFISNVLLWIPWWEPRNYEILLD